MNRWQIARQLRYLLRNETWGTSSNPVFGKNAVMITSREMIAVALEIGGWPVALIEIGGAQADPEYEEEADLLHAEFTIRVVQAVAGHPAGEFAYVGAGAQDRSEAGGRSVGRGVVEFEDPVYSAIQRLQNDSGVRMISFSRGDSGVVPHQNERLGWVAYMDFHVQAICTADRYYHPPRNLKATGGVGQVSLTWTNPALRFDTYRVRLIRKSGSTPPSSVTDGTELTLSGNLVESHTDSGLAAGTYSYALFMAYDEGSIRPENTPSTAEKHSEQETGTTVAGVVVS